MNVHTVILGSALLVTVITAGTVMASMEDPEVTSGTIKVTTHDEATYPALATVTHAQAMDAARQDMPGAILKSELEEENGFLVYNVEVVGTNKDVTHVLVDAGSGKVLLKETDRRDDEHHGRHDGDHDEDHEHRE